MRTRFFIWFLIFSAFWISCGSTLPEIDEPVENKCLIIGSVIFDVNGYHEVNTTVRENIEVAIIGKVIDSGQEKRVGFWAETDDNGYFALANVPPGMYAIKGFRTRTMDLGDVAVINELTDPQRNYFELSRSDAIPMTGSLLDVASKNRVINFKHNIFSLHRNGIISFQRSNQIRDFKLSAGDVINLPPVPSYFLEKFPASAWSVFLDMQMN
ncbi:MAG: carboxypeptidase regulatory-like domain-containing protein [Calditrichaeota bacterium]|nr:carboxypeptidase regulatory-like domain-containing protein [Calditrichota bacterium]